jgi:hypothetical protein
VVVAALAGAAVAVRGPRVAQAGVTCPFDQRAAQLAIDRPPEPDGAALAGLAGCRCGTGEAGQRLGCREPPARVTDLGQQPSRSNGARARQAGEHVRVGVGVQLFGDLVDQHVDLLDERAQRCQQRPGHMCSRDAGVAGRSPRRRVDTGVHRLRCGAAAVADPGQERGQPLRGEPVRAVLAGEAGQELQTQGLEPGQTHIEVRPVNRNPVLPAVRVGIAVVD